MYCTERNAISKYFCNMERILTEYKVIKVAKTRSDNLVDAQIKRKN